ncbi:hypothetical protein SAMN05877753_101109 [Bacillus oleivorans]|uniref:TcaA second domain-containing protein n=1 Tax=Bacillus oleivorans TaxID=1448271 RepID=A0A285CIF6_9BACI|nr:hypothetical protein [Bacillus oleivorans]SNX66798.1 hypothetical protein SAMN05877753_101109 [Bacillus oleivorans]
MELVQKAKQHKKILLAFLAFIAIGIIVLSIIANSQPSTEEVINDFESALFEGNTENLKELIHTESDNVQLSDSFYEHLVAYVQEDPDYAAETVAVLKGQAIAQTEEEFNESFFQDPNLQNLLEELPQSRRLSFT